MFKRKQALPNMAEAVKFLTWQKQQVLAKVPSNVAGINVQRVLSFMKQYKFKVASYLVVDESNVDLLMQVFKEVKHAKPKYLGGICHGEVVYPMGLCVVLRTSELDQTFGPEVFEYLLVHELVHAASWRETNLSVSGEHIIMCRAGLCTEGNRGTFFEEGLTELYAQEYIQYWLGWPHGLGNTGPRAPIDDLPYKYIVSGKYGSTFISLPAVAAHGLQLLIRRNAKIYSALKSVVDGGDYDIVRRAITSAGGKNLFDYLYELEYTKPGFHAGRQAIMDALK